MKDKDIEFYKHIIAIYFYLKNRHSEYGKELLKLKAKVENSPELKNVPWDSIGSGCSASFSKGSPLDRVREAKINAEFEQKNVEKQIVFLEKQYHIMERYNALEERHQSIIYAAYIKMELIKDIAEKLGKKKVYVYRLLDTAVKKMMEDKQE